MYYSSVHRSLGPDGYFMARRRGVPVLSSIITIIGLNFLSVGPPSHGTNKDTMNDRYRLLASAVWYIYRLQGPSFRGHEQNALHNYNEQLASCIDPI
jgi:hypothetical protein